MKYLYYHLWQSLIKIKTNDTPEYNSMILISVAQSFNLFFINEVLHIYFDIDLLLNIYSNLTKTEIYFLSALLLIPFLIFNYLYLVKRKTKIKDKYKDETKTQFLIGVILSHIYVWCSIFVTAYIIQHAS